MKNLSRWSICIHEAGHSVVHFMLYGQPIGCIVFDKGGGLCTPTPDDAQPFDMATLKTAKELSASNDAQITARHLLNEGVFVAAGYAAQEIILREGGQMLYTDTGDSRIIEGYFRAVHPEATEEEVTAFMGLVQVMARAAVKRYQQYILKVALQLNQRGKLTGLEVCAAMFCNEDQDAV
jgi:hypothetical protein